MDRDFALQGAGGLAQYGARGRARSHPEAGRPLGDLHRTAGVAGDQFLEGDGGEALLGFGARSQQPAHLADPSVAQRGQLPVDGCARRRMSGACSTARHSTSTRARSASTSTELLLARQLYRQSKSPWTTSLIGSAMPKPAS
jgi:hypothetical protein